MNKNLCNTTTKHVNIKIFFYILLQFCHLLTIYQNYLYSVTFIGHAYSFNWINTIDDVTCTLQNRKKRKKWNQNDFFKIFRLSL